MVHSPPGFPILCDKTLVAAGVLLALCVPRTAQAVALSVTVTPAKEAHIESEPVRLFTRISNDTAEDFVIERGDAWPVVIVEYQRVHPDGRVESLGSVVPWTNPHFGMPIDGPPLPKWILPKGESFIVDHSVQGLSQPGTLPLRAVFHAMAGREKGTTYASPDLRLEFGPATGADKAAAEFIAGRGTVALGGLNWPSSGVLNALVFNSGSHHGRPMHEYFLQHHGDSLYAWYVRRSVAAYSDADSAYPHWLAIVERAPRDFPFIPEAYMALLDHYSHARELARMSDLYRRLQKQRFRIVSPQTAERLAWLGQQIEWWPPKTPEQEKIARDAEATLRVRAFVTEHPLVLAMTAAYGKARQPNYRADLADMWFYDPRQAWFLTLEYHFTPEGTLGSVRFHGALESFLVGQPLKPLAMIKEALGLDTDGALKTFVDVTLRGESGQGTLQLASKQRVAVRIHLGEAKGEIVEQGGPGARP